MHTSISSERKGDGFCGVTGEQMSKKLRTSALTMVFEIVSPGKGASNSASWWRSGVVLPKDVAAREPRVRMAEEWSSPATRAWVSAVTAQVALKPRISQNDVRGCGDVQLSGRRITAVPRKAPIRGQVAKVKLRKSVGWEGQGIWAGAGLVWAGWVSVARARKFADSDMEDMLAVGTRKRILSRVVGDVGVMKRP